MDSMPPKPEVIPLDIGSIPDELKRRPIWVTWRYWFDSEKEKWIKKPNGWRKTPDGKSIDSSKWKPLDQIKLNSYGPAVALGSCLCGLDLDCCFDSNGELKPFARALIERFPGYVEISPSGTGLHDLFWATEDLKLKGVLRGGKEEFGWEIALYTCSRLFCTTGMIFEGRSVLETFDAEEIIRFHNELEAGTYDVISKPNGKSLEGEFPRGDQSESGKDWAYIHRLAERWGNDPEKIELEFRRSQPYREYRKKWDERRGTGTYLSESIRKAIEERGGKEPSPGCEHKITCLEDIPDIMTRKVPNTDFLVPALGVILGAINLLIGAGGNAKSFLMLALAVALARGEKFLGMECRPSQVLYLDLENPLTEVRKRLELITGEDKPIPGLFVWGTWETEEPPRYRSGTLLDIAKNQKPVIVVDALRDFHDEDEDSSTAMAPVMRYLRKLVIFGSPVIALHHPTWQGKLRGTTVLRDLADTVFKQTLDGDVITLVTEKHRFGGKPTFTIHADLANGKFTPDIPSHVKEMNAEIENLAKLIRQHPGQNQTGLAALGGMGRTKLTDLLNRGRNRGLWVEKPGQRNWKLYYPSVVMSSSSCRESAPIHPATAQTGDLSSNEISGIGYRDGSRQVATAQTAQNADSGLSQAASPFCTCRDLSEPLSIPY